MSVRRLAEDAVQPGEFAFTAENENWARNKLKDFPEGREASGVIPLLMRAQEQEGWVTKPAIEHVADMLDMPLIRVLEVATFYTQFQLAPVGKRAHIQVCGTTPCMLRGAGEIMDVCKRRISPNQFETTDDGSLVLGRGRVSGRLRERADGHGLQGLLRGPDSPSGWTRSSTPSRPATARPFLSVRRSIVFSRHPKVDLTSLTEDPEAAFEEAEGEGEAGRAAGGHERCPSRKPCFAHQPCHRYAG